MKNLLIIVLIFFSYTSYGKEVNSSLKYKVVIIDTTIDRSSNVQFSAGIGMANRFDYYHDANNPALLVLSLEITPQFSKIFYLNLRLDGVKEGNSYVSIFSIVPRFGLRLSKTSKFIGHLGGGLSVYLSDKGHPGIGITAMTSGKLEYEFNYFMSLGIEARVPVNLYEDSGGLSLLTGLSFNIKRFY